MSFNFKKLEGQLDFNDVAFADARVAEEAYRQARTVYDYKGEEEKAYGYRLREREAHIQQISSFGKRCAERFFFYLFARNIYPKKALGAWLALGSIYLVILYVAISLLRDNMLAQALVRLIGAFLISIFVLIQTRPYR